MVIGLTSGREVDLLRPSHEDIEIADIATALSRICRFTGHGRKFYSVAEHSVRASHLVSPEVALQALLHDATEAYLGDVSSPLKKCLGFVYRDMELVWGEAISQRFGVQYPITVRQAMELSLADRYLALAEARFLGIPTTNPAWKDYPTVCHVDHPAALFSDRTAGWPENLARRVFLDRFLEVYRGL